jgi:hypothetical protein
VGDDPHEELVRRGDWTVGPDSFRRRLDWPARRRGCPRKPPPGQEGYFPQFYDDSEDVETVPEVDRPAMSRQNIANEHPRLVVSHACRMKCER